MATENTNYVPKEEDYSATKELPRNRFRIKIHNEPYLWKTGLQFEIDKEGTFEVMSKTGNRALIKKVK